MLERGDVRNCGEVELSSNAGKQRFGGGRVGGDDMSKGRSVGQETLYQGRDNLNDLIGVLRRTAMEQCGQPLQPEMQSNMYFWS